MYTVNLLQSLELDSSPDPGGDHWSGDNPKDFCLIRRIMSLLSIRLRLLVEFGAGGTSFLAIALAAR